MSIHQSHPAQNGEPVAFRVLLIEDNEIDVESVRRSFRRDQMSPIAGTIDLTVAYNLSEATSLLGLHFFDAILLDLGLPEGSGIEVLHKVMNLNLKIPVIILTGNEDDALGVQALRAGADDYLKKSCVSAETLPRSVRYSIERNHRLLTEAQLHRAQAEISAAETIQQKLLPQFFPEIAGFDIYGACLPAEQIGGDLYDFLAYDSVSCIGVVADVSGHGLSAGILMTELHGLLHGLVEQNVSLPRLMSAANYRTDKATEPHQFITMISYHLSATHCSFSYISAGHPAWLLHGDGSHQPLKSHYLPLGIDVNKKNLSLSHVKLQTGDIVVLPTDGIFESRNDSGARFGSLKMLDEIHSCRELSAKEIVLRILDTAKCFSKDEALTDDCTLVIIKVL